MFLWSILGLYIGICLLPSISLLLNHNFLFVIIQTILRWFFFLINVFFPNLRVSLSLYCAADALESLRQSCESICPNDGFLEQVIEGNAISSSDFWDSIISLLHHVYVTDSKCLFFSFLLWQLKMFEDMGFKVDHANPIYKCFRLKVLGIISRFFFFFGTSAILRFWWICKWISSWMNQAWLLVRDHISLCVLKILVLSLIVHMASSLSPFYFLSRI